MKIKVDDLGKLYIDDVETEIEKLNCEILEKILEKGLSNDANFELPSDTSHPVASLIKEFEELVKPESDFRKEILEIIKEKEENDLKISISENTNEENSK